MNLMRYTVIDRRGGVSFVADCHAAYAFAAACSYNPATLEEFLEVADRYHHSVKEQVLCGLAIFDEHNVDPEHLTIHQAFDHLPPVEQPAFRVMDERTREESLRPVKAGALIFNLPAKRIIQMQNGYPVLGRRGRAHIFDGERLSSMFFIYRLPEEWALVP